MERAIIGKTQKLVGFLLKFSSNRQKNISNKWQHVSVRIKPKLVTNQSGSLVVFLNKFDWKYLSATMFYNIEYSITT